MKIDENRDYFFISMGNGTIKFQRKHVINATDNSLSSDEETIVLLCHEILNKQGDAHATLTCDLKDGEFKNGRRD